MKKFKELNACIARLQEVQAGNDLEPEQRKEIERALVHIKRLRRLPHLTQREVFCAVREIADSLLFAFLKK